MDFRKTYFILPNLFTLSNAFCGFYSVALSCDVVGNNAEDQTLYKAALAILVGLIFDGADGRIARLTKTQSELGLQLDSLADVITFGIAPAMLIYRWGLEDFGVWGVFVAFIFVGCGALRLARFNVMETRKSNSGAPGKYMIGLPIPIAANLLVALVLAAHTMEIYKIASQTSIVVLVCVLGYLMISRVRFRSLKDLQPNKRTIAIASAIVVFCLIVAIQISAPAVLLSLIALFIVMGLVEEVLTYRRREKNLPPEEPEDREEDVLEELGISQSDDSVPLDTSSKN